MSSRDDVRLDAILEVLMSYARQDFSPRLLVSERLDVIDAIATGINLLAEELDGEVASRRELEAAHARLVVAEKFAAVGQLASGVAHELNNPAAWVLLGVDAARRRLRAAATNASPAELADELASIEATLADVHAGMERIRHVIGDLRSLSRVDVDAQGTVDLNQVVRSACQLARPAYLSVAKLVLDLGDVPPLTGDVARLGQLVTNLILNAAYAVADGGGHSEIVVTTSAEGDHVLLAVDDNGVGIPDELVERVFDPYFTTKPSEVGTGLGLALVRKIAERHGGTARACRSLRGGARVEVRLPYGDGTPLTDRQAALEAPAEDGPRLRILVIDDEPLLLNALEQTIGVAHEVVTALGGEAGCELLARDRAFDAILCDLQMPIVDGVAIYETVERDAPELLSRLVLMSGGAVTPRATQFIEKVRPRLVSKPIDLDDLLATLQGIAATR